MRGKHDAHVGEGVGVRLIPACAGKTAWAGGRCGAGRAHPRVCGENGSFLPVTVRVGGSSPRVRGKQTGVRERAQTRGLIPACAGKTARGRRGDSASPAHPRVCGENILGSRTTAAQAGSSPRVRGKQFAACAGDPVGGLIPACAGKTRELEAVGYRFRAHPRVCGENLLDGDPPVTTSGSSPRVRGKHTAGAPLRPDPGLIPACAGKTGRPRTRPWRSGAHPRVCGENPAAATNAEVARGSSPRVRGKRLDVAHALALVRLIPARAGKTRRG